MIYICITNGDQKDKEKFIEELRKNKFKLVYDYITNERESSIKYDKVIDRHRFFELVQKGHIIEVIDEGGNLRGLQKPFGCKRYMGVKTQEEYEALKRKYGESQVVKVNTLGIKNVSSDNIQKIIKNILTEEVG